VRDLFSSSYFTAPPTACEPFYCTPRNRTMRARTVKSRFFSHLGQVKVNKRTAHGLPRE
jgi:hypothetical protein